MKKLIDGITKRIETHHTLYDTPVSGILWEEILFKSFLELKRCKPNAWSSGSHRVGADIINVKKWGDISCKSGVLANNRLKFSGSRTTQYKTIEEKVEFFSTKKEDNYFCLSRNPRDWEVGKKIYYFCFFPHIEYGKLDWETNSGGWGAVNESMSCTINKSMSDQLWTDISIKNIKFKIINLDNDLTSCFS